jgi:imidazoleglycerol-phosphate dehydratase
MAIAPPESGDAARAARQRCQADRLAGNAGHARIIDMSRLAHIRRETTETSIEATWNLDGEGRADVATGVGFLDHMLNLFAKHGAFDLTLRARGDLHVDAHHTVEDVGLVLGQALSEAAGDKAGIRRYGHFTLPMDETLVTVAIDLSGRSYLVLKAPLSVPKIGDFDAELLEDFWQAFAAQARCNLHIVLHHGRNAHHIVEAVFKCTARALRMALESDPRMLGIPSTKGAL